MLTAVAIRRKKFSTRLLPIPPPTRLVSLATRTQRAASTHVSASGTYGPEYESQEGFGHPLFKLLGLSLLGLAIYNYSPSILRINSDQRPMNGISEENSEAAGKEHSEAWLTRYLTRYVSKNPDELKDIAMHNMNMVLQAADLAYFKASVERPIIRRLGNSGDFTIASPYGLVPGAQTDLSDLRIKSYRDDLQKPELPPRNDSDKELSN